jgi:hypothetical protein
MKKMKMMKMLTESRTLNQQFEAWKGTDKVSKSWGEYWDNHVRDTIKIYEKLNWSLICLSWNTKTPVKGVHWAKRTLEYKDAYTLMMKKMNLGINLYNSQLIVADIDDNKIPTGLVPFINKTMSAITTSSHYHIYFDYDIDLSKEKLNKLALELGYEKPELWRGGNNKAQYTVIPLSMVNKKYYEWIYSDNLMSLSELMEAMKL